MAVGVMIDGSSVEEILAETLGGQAADYETMAQQVFEVAEQLLEDIPADEEQMLCAVIEDDDEGSRPSFFLSLLERIRWGQDATALLEADIDESTPGYLFRLPLFLPGTNVRMQWSEPLIGFVDPGTTRELRWRAWDRKYGELGGVAQIRGAMNFVVDLGEGRSARVTDRFHSRCRAELQNAAKSGDAALWELIELWRPKLLTQVQIASSGVLHEIAGGGDSNDELVGGVIDIVEAEQLVDELLYGKEGEDSIFIRIAHRVAGDLRDGSGDPWAWVQRNLRSASESAIRRLIGDPAAGRKIRRVYRSLGSSSTLDDVLEAYREEFPTEKMGKKRIVDALSAGSTAHRSSLQMSLLTAMV